MKLLFPLFFGVRAALLGIRRSKTQLERGVRFEEVANDWTFCLYGLLKEKLNEKRR